MTELKVSIPKEIAIDILIDSYVTPMESPSNEDVLRVESEIRSVFDNNLPVPEDWDRRVTEVLKTVFRCSILK